MLFNTSRLFTLLSAVAALVLASSKTHTKPENNGLQVSDMRPAFHHIPGLWIDVFQEIKSMGFNVVSLYVDWSLVEWNPGHVITDGVWRLDEFFDAASQDGLYLIARTGPHINAETTAGGIPGWVLRNKAAIRSDDPEYMNVTANFGVKIFSIDMVHSDSNSSSRSERYLRRTPLYSRDCYPWEWDIGKFLCHRTFGPHIHRQHSVHAHIANKQGRGIKIPQLGGALTLDGSDHKFHVTDYDVGGINLTYSSAEIFTWARGSGSTRVLILYGGAGETHEFGLPSYLGKPTSIEGDHIEIKQRRSAWVVKWHVTPARRIVRVADLQVYLLWRNVSYNYWVTELPVLGPIGNYSSPSKDVIVEAGYLIRTADLINNQLRLTGDVDGTTEIEVISTPATRLKVIALDREVVQTSTTSNVNLRGTVRYNAPKLDVPDLSNLEWKFIDPLPEIQASQLDTPSSLYSMDYGYHTGSRLSHGHFNANGRESNVRLDLSGGTGFGHSVWLNDTFLGSWNGSSTNSTVVHNMSVSFFLSQGSPFLISVLIDHMDQDEEAPGTDAIKFPRGIPITIFWATRNAISRGS
ncbi:hypothetical protein E8E15_010235 [Penicillium rubens]|nr:hypothetical protein E8E15_010235 [Penicillium rubens]